jgi:3-keto-5-aminohexanoate cleavage enzyme
MDDKTKSNKKTTAPAPLVITCPIIGAELTREQYPNLPLTPDELAIAAEQAVAAGATVIHLHVRDPQGQPSQNIEIFREVSEKIKKRCDCIIQFSTGGAVGTSLEERMKPLDLNPAMGSLTLGTLNFGNDVFFNDQATILALAQRMKEKNVIPEVEIFDYGMLDTLHDLINKEILPSKFSVGFILGMKGGINGHIRSLQMLVDHLPPGILWSVGGIGRHQLPLAIHAVLMGGNVRVGLEDNIYYRKGELAKSNAQLIERVVKIAREVDRKIATLAETKLLLNINKN